MSMTFGTPAHSSPGVVRVVIADDHAVVREGLRALVDAQPGLRVVGEAADGQEAWLRACELKPDVLATWCRELKQALGCGGSVEDASIVLQGDQRSRLPALLTARGVGRVTVS